MTATVHQLRPAAQEDPARQVLVLLRQYRAVLAMEREAAAGRDLSDRGRAEVDACAGRVLGYADSLVELCQVMAEAGQRNEELIEALRARLRRLEGQA